jgi:regulator of replication initiation timing
LRELLSTKKHLEEEIARLEDQLEETKKESSTLLKQKQTFQLEIDRITVQISDKKVAK